VHLGIAMVAAGDAVDVIEESLRRIVAAGSPTLTDDDEPVAITRLFVRMYPSERITSPEPVPLPLPLLAAIVTTEGTTRSATGVTGQELTADEADEEAGVTVEPDDAVVLPMTPPMTPPRPGRSLPPSRAATGAIAPLAFRRS
jgi:hypothetical protein